MAGTPASKPHAVAQVNGSTYTYDCNGNLLSGGNRTYTWDHENRPTQIVSGTVTETYQYDADGERINRTVNGSTTTVYLGGLWEETSAGTIKQYYPFNGIVVAVRDSSTGVSYLHDDHLGSVSLTTDAAQTPTRQYFGPWGDVRSGGISATSLNYTGQRLDSGTALLYYHARWALGSDTPVFVDTRVELYPLALWREYLAISDGQRVNELLIDKYDVVRALVSLRTQPRLVVALASDPAHWIVEYRDEQAANYRRRR